MEKHLKGKLAKTCPQCGQPYEWLKVNFIRPDGYFDWRLDVFCLCGEALDPEIQEQAHEAYYEALTQAIREIHEAELDRCLGSALNRSLNELAHLPRP